MTNISPCSDAVLRHGTPGGRNTTRRRICLGPAWVGLDLSGFDLSRADLQGADLRGTNCSDTNLAGAHLDGGNLFKAPISRRGPPLQRAFLIPPRAGRHLEPERDRSRSAGDLRSSGMPRPKAGASRFRVTDYAD